MNQTAFVSAIIPAAGKGRRLKANINKQFILIQNRPILYYTLKTFETSPLINEIILVVPEAWREEVSQHLVPEFQFSKIRQVIAGGYERYESVANGLNYVDPQTDYVVIHDSVRPFLTASLLEQVILAGFEFQAVTLGVPVKDTIKRVADGFITQTLDRSLLWAIQTPQVFKYDLIQQAYAHIQDLKTTITDDAMLVEALGFPVKIVPGDDLNIKITSVEDLQWAELLVPKLFPVATTIES
ncbi:2-C-methyl-D-erythritol 4-phosphate cytidylyltransferase [candidate division KSB1 bacterium]|nr:2-C-methyl-D-erythritol 4-phosphate cytidylyltransferase [candidate division KSB1 bacterium]